MANRFEQDQIVHESMDSPDARSLSQYILIFN